MLSNSCNLLNTKTARKLRIGLGIIKFKHPLNNFGCIT